MNKANASDPKDVKEIKDLQIKMYCFTMNRPS